MRPHRTSFLLIFSVVILSLILFLLGIYHILTRVEVVLSLVVISVILIHDVLSGRQEFTNRIGQVLARYATFLIVLESCLLLSHYKLLIRLEAEMMGTLQSFCQICIIDPLMFACHRTLGFLRSIRTLEPQILTSCPCSQGLLDFMWFLRLLTDFDWRVRFV